MSITPELRATYRSLLEQHVPGVRFRGAEVTGHVPWREDRHPSFSANLDKGVWYDQARGEGGSVIEFRARLQLPDPALTAPVIEATFDYRDADGGLLYQVVRYIPKSFRQRRPDGRGGWIHNLDNVERVPYRLPELGQATVVYVPEGEKQVERLRALGLVATCNAGGAGKWRDEYSVHLAGKAVVILPDNDDAGERHGLQVAASIQPLARSVTIVRLPDLPGKGDVVDWLDAGHTKDELARVVASTPPYEPPVSSDTNPWARAKAAPDLLAEQDEPFEGWAKDLVSPGSITLIGAPRGLGKTQVIHAIAVGLTTEGEFRGERMPSLRVLLVDRDNPPIIVKKRLRAWGATDAPQLRVLTRSEAPDLKNKNAWETFPVSEYDVVIVDSVGAATEGVTEKEGKQTTEVIATVTNLARQGVAVVLLQNTTKDGANLRGRGEWADRSDIVYEVRDATGLSPSGKRPWWMELPEAGEAAWADRAARRKGQLDLRLAFIPSKFRIGVEPEPFCLELHLPEDQLWTLTDVTATVVGAGQDAVSAAERASADHTRNAEADLAELVQERAIKKPLQKTEAERYLVSMHKLKRADARRLIKESASWELTPVRRGDGKQAAYTLMPPVSGNGDGGKKAKETGGFGPEFVAGQARHGRQRRGFKNTCIDEGLRQASPLPGPASGTRDAVIGNDQAPAPAPDLAVGPPDSESPGTEWEEHDL